jgi:hypothetical protein
MSEANELDAIRARHEAVSHDFPDSWMRPIYYEHIVGPEAHTDRATLLRLLDAAREELREVREAAGVITGRKWVELLYPELPDYKSVSVDITLGDLRRLAAALKAPPTRAQGESS